ncbi:MAG: MFS transporter [Acidobacteria bacterium]|nr:MFS transporter [Acidobacteriota bacterium]
MSEANPIRMPAAATAVPSHPPAAEGLWSAVRGYPARAFLICLAGVSLENMDQALFAFVLPQISKELGWSVIERGWYIAVTYSLAGLGIASLGVLTDRAGRKAVFSTSMLVGSLFVTAMYWARSTWSMVVLRTTGFAMGGIMSPVVGTIVVEESPPRYRGLLTGILQIGYPIGWFLASQLAVFVMVRWSWRQVFFVSLLSVPYLWVIRRYLRETPAFEAAKAARSAAVEGGGVAVQPSMRDLFAPDMRFRTVVLFLGEYFHVFAYGSTILLTAYFQEYRGWAPADSVWLVGWSYGIGAIGYVLAAIVGEFVMKRRNTIIVWAWLGSVAFAALIWWTESWAATAVAFCLMTVFFYGTTAVKFTFIAENFPARLRATGVTFSGSLAVNLGVASGPLALSYAVAHLGWPLAYTICGILPIFVSGMFFLLLPADPIGVREDEALAAPRA